MVSVQWDGQDRCFVLRASVLLQHSREALFEFRQKKMLDLFPVTGLASAQEGMTR